MAEGLSGQTPIFGGSTGGLLTKAAVEEKYAITWTSSKKQVFEMPTGGAAIMNEGENLLYLADQEHVPQPLGDGVTAHRPSGETQYLHPADGVFPEKVNEGRGQVNTIGRNIGANPDPATVKFSGKTPYEV